MSTTTVQTTASREKIVEGVRRTENLQKCLEEAQRKAKDLNWTSESVPAAVSPLLPSMTIEQASSLVVNHQPKDDTISMEIIRAMSIVLGNAKVEEALSAGLHQLAFTPQAPSLPDTPQAQKWKQRMQRLALLQEERKYSKLTNNLGKVVEDDVSIRSMTYAASIGLNMIVAPISFGVFMYFFSGGIIDFFWQRPEASPLASSVDNRKVICAVVSGVAMLIVEMLLFVIRTHEMDKAMRKKTKAKSIKPFGPYSSTSLKTFKGE